MINKSCYNCQSSPVQSIIISTYNRKDMLAEALDSVLKQSQKSLEVLIIDDCSTDGTEEFVKTITDSRVHYFRNEKNSGPEFNRSYGLRQSRGKYITFLDDDDYYTDYDFYSKAIKIFEEHDSENAPLSFVCANAESFRVDLGKRSTKHNIGTPGRVKGVDYILKRKKPHSTFPTVFKAEILRKAGLDNLVIFDTMTYLEAALYGDAYFMSDYVGVYRLHKESITLGYTHNPGNESRYYAKALENTRRNKLIAEKLYTMADKEQVRKWYIKSLVGTIEYARLRMNNETRNKIFIHIFRQSGFMPRFWIAFLWHFIKRQLRKITPLRKVYRFIKYRGKVPEDDLI